jgi:hypothetical protein
VDKQRRKTNHNLPKQYKIVATQKLTQKFL